jgi:hypothetical protein
VKLDASPAIEQMLGAAAPSETAAPVRTVGGDDLDCGAHKEVGTPRTRQADRHPATVCHARPHRD